MSAALNEASTPKLARGFKFRRDEVRSQWVVLGPERAFVPDDVAAEVLKLVDGHRTLGTIIDDLAARFDAPRAVIATDVTSLAADLAARGVLTA